MNIFRSYDETSFRWRNSTQRAALRHVEKAERKPLRPHTLQEEYNYFVTELLQSVSQPQDEQGQVEIADAICRTSFTMRVTFVRQAISVPSFILNALAQDEALLPYWDVAKVKKNTPDAILRHLVENGDSSTKIAIGKMLKKETEASPSILELIAEGPEPKVHIWAARAAATRPETLARFAQSQSRTLRGAVAANRATPGYVLTQLSTDRDLHIRLFVAANPSTPLHTYWKLLHSRDARHHDMLRANPNRDLVSQLTYEEAVSLEAVKLDASYAELPTSWQEKLVDDLG